MNDRETETRYAAWLRYVNGHVDLLDSGKSIPPGPFEKPLQAAASTAAAQPLRVVLCSPHPDDEALTGALPLRLRQELGAAITNCAITLGSDVARREARRHELETACRVLGFELVIPRSPGGFDSVAVKTRTERPGLWDEMVETLSKTFESLQPDVVFAPHAEDWHTAHIGASFLAVDALSDILARSQRRLIPLIETSYWHEHARPNLMAGVSPEIVAALVMATAEHAGEVSRNAYHLRLPSRLIENVRRGAETVGGQGVAAPDFPFAELYRVTFVTPKGRLEPKPGGMIVGPADPIDFRALLKAFQP